MKVGDLITDSEGLYSGSGVYSTAVVVCLEPYTLMSKSGDMRWSTKEPHTATVIGTASTDSLHACRDRAGSELEKSQDFAGDEAKIFASLILCIEGRPVEAKYCIMSNEEGSDELYLASTANGKYTWTFHQKNAMRFSKECAKDLIDYVQAEEPILITVQELYDV